MKSEFIRSAAIKKFVSENGKRVGRDFLAQLDLHIRYVMVRAVNQHNGGRKTLDQAVAVFVGAK